MVYKILIQERKDANKTYYSPLMDKVTNPNQTVVTEEWQTTDLAQLELKIEELVRISGTEKIRVISDVTYDLEITVPIG